VRIYQMKRMTAEKTRVEATDRQNKRSVQTVQLSI
jgi:hypothetical protein